MGGTGFSSQGSDDGNQRDYVGNHGDRQQDVARSWGSMTASEQTSRPGASVSGRIRVSRRKEKRPGIWPRALRKERADAWARGEAPVKSYRSVLGWPQRFRFQALTLER